MGETQVWPLSWEDPLQRIATDSSIPAWEIPDRSLVDYSPGDRESGVTEPLTLLRPLDKNHLQNLEA